MSKKRFTFTLDVEVVKSAKKLAVKQDTNLSAMTLTEMKFTTATHFFL